MFSILQKREEERLTKKRQQEEEKMTKRKKREEEKLERELAKEKLKAEKTVGCVFFLEQLSISYVILSH